MDKNTKNKIKKQLTTPALIALIAAVFMVASVFLPYGVAIDERAEWIKEHPDSVVYEDLNITASDMKNVSILEYTRIYYTLCEELWHDSFYGVFYLAIFCLIVGLSVIARLFAWGRKPIGTILFTLMSMGVFQIQNTDYTMRGILPGAYYDWGVAHYLFPIAVAVALVASVWMLVKKIKAKKQVIGTPTEETTTE